MNYCNQPILGQYIQGKMQLSNGNSPKRRTLTNPATGEAIKEIEFAGEAELEAAVASAKQAFPAWSTTPPLKRARILFKFKELLEQRQDELAAIVTQEHGKTLDDAKGSIGRGVELVEFMCGIPHLLKGDYSENVGSSIDCYTIRQPLGLCAGVSPFNFPVMVPLWMIIPAIACGNCFILKPSEQNPSATLFLAELLTEAGIPDGVVTVLNGDKNIVDLLIKHPAISTMTAVASTPVAQYIYQQSILAGKRSHTFGGAKNHGIVMPDADLIATADALAGAAFGSAGERCMAISVAVVVGDDTADALVPLIAEKARALKIGPGTEAGMEMGPLVSQTHLERVKGYIDSGVKEGASLVVDGRERDFPDNPAGNFLGASVFDHVKPQMKIYQEEIFGPILVIVRVYDFEQALALINQNPYGNGTTIFTQSGETAHTFAQSVQVGMVGINVPIPVPVAYHPFGGWKQSVFGDINMHGEQSIQFYTKTKTITVRWPNTSQAVSGFIMPHVK
jgi:malonate-semialdehyde dehydrogenase (acetylating)/methylmalonate-semialdehyde dehydrogenase